jgi:GT2 family glycosyltransferase
VLELSVVIPTYRRHDALRRTVAALEDQTVSPDRFELIVVDDPNDDDPAAVGAALASPDRPFSVRQLHREVAGVAAARNVGWRAATAPLVLFLGDDILASRDLIAEHLAWHTRQPEPEVAVLGNVRWADELPRTPLMLWLDDGIQFDYGWLEHKPAGWGHFYTANVSIKRMMLERTGGFDQERFPFGYEDTDLGYRLAEAGLRLLYNRSARAEHLHQPTLEEWAGRMQSIARAERTWIDLHPDMEPYFERLFRDALELPPARGRMATALALRIPRWVPRLGPSVWWHLDVYFRQQLAPHFLGAWDGVR